MKKNLMMIVYCYICSHNGPSLQQIVITMRQRSQSYFFVDVRCVLANSFVCRIFCWNWKCALWFCYLILSMGCSMCSKYIKINMGFSHTVLKYWLCQSHSGYFASRLLYCYPASIAPSLRIQYANWVQLWECLITAQIALNMSDWCNVTEFAHHSLKHPGHRKFLMQWTLKLWLQWALRLEAQNPQNAKKIEDWYPVTS